MFFAKVLGCLPWLGEGIYIWRQRMWWTVAVYMPLELRQWWAQLFPTKRINDLRRLIFFSLIQTDLRLTRHATSKHNFYLTNPNSRGTAHSTAAIGIQFPLLYSSMKASPSDPCNIGPPQYSPYPIYSITLLLKHTEKANCLKLPLKMIMYLIGALTWMTQWGILILLI